MNNKTTQEQINLIDSIGDLLERSISLTAKEMFLSDPVIKLSKNLPPEIQRMVINKFFYNLLLRWRNNSTVPVFTTIAMLCDDGDIENWIQMFIIFVIPFLRDNCVMGLPVRNLTNKGASNG